MTAAEGNELLPLCVDMDGTLLRTDSLDECFWAGVSERPILLLRVPFWLLRGRASLKAKLAGFGLPTVETWPLRETVLESIRRERATGRSVWLVTAADQRIANAVAERTGVFDGVLASDGSTNLKGSAKASALIEKFGKQGFWYIGDSRADVEIWKHAAKGFRVTTKTSVGSSGSPVQALTVTNPGPWAWGRQFRLHQWVKNLLLLVPMLAAHKVDDFHAWMQVFAGILFMGLVASGTYVYNDCLDLHADRRVRSKRERPLARGDLPLRHVVLWGTAGYLVGLIAAFLLDPVFGFLLLFYSLVSIAYSSFLKRLLLLDVLVLSGFYVWRLLMGGELAGVPLSPWLLGFALFLFISIALAKRYAELLMEQAEGVMAHLRRPYRATDLPVVLALGIGSALVSVLVLALYVNSDKSQELYAHPDLLWLVCPVLLYWLARVWFKAHRGELSADPVLFAIRDRVSYGVLILLVLVPFLATLSF